MSECVVRMEMPEDCFECPFGIIDDTEDGVWCNALAQQSSGQREDCPIICSLPEGHGRADAIEELISFDIRNLPEGLYTVKNGVVYTARVKVSGGNVLNLKTGESHWEDDRIVGGEQVFPKRGEWKPFDLTWGRSIYSCTACGESADVPTANGKALYKYCPNCGAKMEVQDGENET